MSPAELPSGNFSNFFAQSKCMLQFMAHKHGVTCAVMPRLLLACRKPAAWCSSSRRTST